MNPYRDIGDRSTFTVNVGDIVNGDVPISPPVVVFKVLEPDGTETTYEAGVSPEFVEVETGVYQLSVAYTLPGNWFIRVVALDVDDTPLGALERRIIVRDSAFATPLSQLA